MCVCGSIPELGCNEPVMAKEMACADGEHWSLRLEIPDDMTEIEYHYLLRDADRKVTPEPWRRKHRIAFDRTAASYCLYDYWREEPTNIALYTSAFTKNLFAHNGSEPIHEQPDRSLIIRVPNPRVRKNQRVALAGNQACLGHWDTTQAKLLCPSGAAEWEVCLNADEIRFPFEYKFFVCDETKHVCHWEKGDNRVLTEAPSETCEVTVISEYPYREDLPEWKGAGTVIPVFSLRSEQSFGVGDLHDLRLLIDWAEQTQQCVIQVLPMNDTTCTHTWKDSYPYSAISMYALHPMYISLYSMGTLNDPDRMAYFRKKQIALNEKEEVDYEAVERYKTTYCRAFFEQEGAAILSGCDFKRFLENNRKWLTPYAAFCYLRDQYHTADFSQWGKDAIYSPLRIEKLCAENSPAYPEISYVYFLQYVLHSQFQAVSNHARRKGIILKGDLPIGIHRTSVEAWTDTRYFNMNGQAGAPPDDFSAMGQNWSFPTYHWEIMEEDGFTWWKKRFGKMSDYFDSFRIDHILGFFRIWEIPLDYVQGLCGHFRPALPLTVGEIESYGLAFKKEYTSAAIHRKYLPELFGEQTEVVIDHYLSPMDADHIMLNPFCDTQRKIRELFEGHEDEASRLIQSGLYALANEVLFLEDPYEPGKYHPRISASQSYRYQELTKTEQTAFDKLYTYFFYERHHDFWKATALNRLRPLVATTEMLVCGEDLGMIPDSVHEVMEELHILSLELGRISKAFGQEFSDLKTVPYYSVCTTSTHDMSPLRTWWEEEPERTQRYAQSLLKRSESITDECTTEIAEQIITEHLHAHSMLTILPLQDWLAVDHELKRKDALQERINIPADPNHYWRYRIHIPLERLLQASEFNQKIRAMLSKSHRTNIIT